MAAKGAIRAGDEWGNIPPCWAASSVAPAHRPSGPRSRGQSHLCRAKRPRARANWPLVLPDRRFRNRPDLAGFAPTDHRWVGWSEKGPMPRRPPRNPGRARSRQAPAAPRQHRAEGGGSVRVISVSAHRAGLTLAVGEGGRKPPPGRRKGGAIRAMI